MKYTYQIVALLGFSSGFCYGFSKDGVLTGAAHRDHLTAKYVRFLSKFEKSCTSHETFNGTIEERVRDCKGLYQRLVDTDKALADYKADMGDHLFYATQFEEKQIEAKK